MQTDKPVKRWCWYCAFRGNKFRLPPRYHGHVHCNHPNNAVSGNDGSVWGTVRDPWNNCKHWIQE